MKQNNLPNRIQSVRLLLVLSTIAISSVVAIGPTVAASPQTRLPWTEYANRADGLLNVGKLKEAERYYRQALRAAEGTPDNIPAMALCQNKLANVLALQDKTAEAVETYRKSLALLARDHKLSSRKLRLKTIIALGSIYESVGDHASAAQLYRISLAQSEKEAGPYDPALAGRLKNLSHLAIQTSKTGKQPGSMSELAVSSDLDASERMAKMIASRKNTDLINNNDQTDANLLSEFRKQILDTRSGVRVCGKNQSAKSLSKLSVDM
ncbi:MAG TPA: tetratricopeptide repeat protein [Planktothrix sp.]